MGAADLLAPVSREECHLGRELVPLVTIVAYLLVESINLGILGCYGGIELPLPLLVLLRLGSEFLLDLLEQFPPLVNGLAHVLKHGSRLAVSEQVDSRECP